MGRSFGDGGRSVLVFCLSLGRADVKSLRLGGHRSEHWKRVVCTGEAGATLFILGIISSSVFLYICLG